MESQVIGLLSASLVRPLVLAVAAWLILRIFQVRHPASRHLVWTAVLIGMLALPIVSVIAPHWKVPVLPRKNDVSPASRAVTPARESTIEPVVSAPLADARGSEEAQTELLVPAAPPNRENNPVSIESLLVWIYLAGAFAMAVYRLAGWVLLRRLISKSSSLRTPWLRESCAIVTPVAAGVWRPMVLLPSAWRDWSSDTRRAVLAHEFAHIRRNDALVSALARFVKCVLWFHPLAWWVSRRISNLAELACDAAALERTQDPAGYSRVLLAFANAVNQAGHRVALPGLAMAAGSGMGQRIDQVFELSNGNMRKLARPGAVLALLGIPVMCVAATVGLGEAMARPRLLFPIATPPPPIIRFAPPAARPAPILVAQAQAAAPATTPAQAPSPGPVEVPPPLVVDAPARRVDAGPNLYSKEKEAALGRGLAAQITRNTPLLDNAAALEYVNRFAGKLAAQLPDAPFAYTFAITATDVGGVLHEPIALPGGYIFVSPALFHAANDEAEFAGMLAHAMAHIAARHGARQATKSELAQMATMPLIFYGGWVAYGARQTSGVAIPLSFLQFSKVYEREADQLAVKMTAGAGYDPEAIVRYFRRVWTDDLADAPGAKVFAPSDSRDNRIATIESAVLKLGPSVTYTSSDEFLRIRTQIPEPESAPAAQDRPALKRKDH